MGMIIADDRLESHDFIHEHGGLPVMNTIHYIH